MQNFNTYVHGSYCEKIFIELILFKLFCLLKNLFLYIFTNFILLYLNKWKPYSK